ncbi:hypothetical protein [Actinoplanes philippinensis]|uniref:hypothetical protein n=1 Tax=Actinoplanes philippinensis TaxID=35752 RepID=UPI0033CE9022
MTILRAPSRLSGDEGGPDAGLNERLHALIRQIAGHGTADRIVEALRAIDYLGA